MALWVRCEDRDNSLLDVSTCVRFAVEHHGGSSNVVAYLGHPQYMREIDSWDVPRMTVRQCGSPFAAQRAMDELERHLKSHARGEAPGAAASREDVEQAPEAAPAVTAEDREWAELFDAPAPPPRQG